jgi:uncharacterized protein (TIGR02147 family)
MIIALKLDPEEARRFRTMILASDGETSEVRRKYIQELDEILAASHSNLQNELSTSAFRVIADWYHLAILELLLTKDYARVESKNVIAWISSRLGLSTIQVKNSLRHLEKLELVEFLKGKPMRTEGTLKTGDQIPSSAIRSHHKQYLEKAVDAIDEQSIEECDFSGVIIPADSSKIPQAKKAIQEFRMKMNRILKGERADEVYRVSIGLFRVSKKGKQK